MKSWRGAAFDYLLCGDVALLKERNIFGSVCALTPLPSIYLRRRKSGDFVILQEGEPLVYSPDDIIYIKSYEPAAADLRATGLHRGDPFRVTEQ
ncbi:Uncharacterised protein [Klebsiella michiganensis]|uniref:Uncharacterized protein n=1 Tax=Klebsiella michiganensis TaxID=1134687 RepID=A0A7H4MYN2_9ENTR|nr:Uncharacterised protein [Klebsiella michiganensis]